MRSLTTKTLENISRHKDKLLRLASFYSESNFDCFVDNLSNTSEITTNKELIEAIIKDINKTALFIEKASKLVSTTDNNGIVQGATDKPTIKEIFKENLSEDGNRIQLGSINISVGIQMNKEEAKEALTRSIFGIGYQGLVSSKNNIEKVFTITKESIQSEEEAIKYFAEVPLRTSYQDILDKIDLTRKSFEESRRKYKVATGNKYRNLNMIDREITGTRAMIDSITKQSFHISRDEIIQVPKKSEADKATTLQNQLKDNKYVSDVEAHQDVDLDKVSNLLSQIKDLKINIPRDLTLKIRKLGNYRASGLCMPSADIIAIDIEKPSSLIHELTHLVDLSNPEIKESNNRKTIIDKFKKKIDVSKLQQNKEHYFTSDNEVIARMGEIAYILNQHDYSSENFKDFVKKVNDHEDKDESMCVVKPIDTYINNSNIYFGFGTEAMTPDDLMEIKEYYQSYWGVNKEIIPQVVVKSPEPSKAPQKKSFKEQSKFTSTSFSNITKESVVDSYNVARESGIMDSDVFASRILENMRNLHRSKKRIKGDEVTRQFETVETLFRHILQDGSVSEKLSAYESLSLFSGSYSINSTKALESLMESLPQDNIKDLYDDATYTNSDGIDYMKRHAGATAYLNSYGITSGNKMITELQIDFLRDFSIENIKKLSETLKPNSKSFYEMVLMKQLFCTDDQVVEMKSMLKSENLLSVFKNNEVEIISKLFSSKLRSYTSVGASRKNMEINHIIKDILINMVSDSASETPFMELRTAQDLSKKTTQAVEEAIQKFPEFEVIENKEEIIEEYINIEYLRDLSSSLASTSKDWKIFKKPPTTKKKITTQKMF